LEQAEQLFAALRWMGREVEMVIFRGESHGLSRGGRPGNRIERQRRILGWFEKHLGTNPVLGHNKS
jgi:dipeptidyl aminopeptidase/acylaminoacyl peptidase